MKNLWLLIDASSSTNHPPIILGNISGVHYQSFLPRDEFASVWEEAMMPTTASPTPPPTSTPTSVMKWNLFDSPAEVAEVEKKKKKQTPTLRQMSDITNIQNCITNRLHNVDVQTKEVKNYVQLLIDENRKLHATNRRLMCRLKKKEEELNAQLFKAFISDDLDILDDDSFSSFQKE